MSVFRSVSSRPLKLKMRGERPPLVAAAGRRHLVLPLVHFTVRHYIHFCGTEEGKIITLGSFIPILHSVQGAVSLQNSLQLSHLQWDSKELIIPTQPIKLLTQGRVIVWWSPYSQKAHTNDTLEEGEAKIERENAKGNTRHWFKKTYAHVINHRGRS